VGCNSLFYGRVLVSLGVTPGTDFDYSSVGCELPDTETKFNGEF
jgi:hypothetical protein